MKLAGHAEVVRKGRDTKLVIDGEEFPWYVAEDGLRWELVTDGCPALTITIPVERVTIDDDLAPVRETEAAT